MTKRQERQRFIRHYKDTTGERELDMHKVAEFAKSMGWKMPKPPSEIDLLAKQFAEAASAETGTNRKTGRPYRVYHAVPAGGGQQNLFVYVDIHDATRNQMQKSCVMRREQMVNDGLQLSFDMEHWNSLNPAQEPLDLPMDLAMDIEIAKAARDAPDKAAD